MWRRPRFESVRITGVGAWYVGLTVVVGVAAANTGNNSLYLVEALLLALLAASGLVSRRNLRGLEARLSPSREIYAGLPFALGCRIESRDRRTAKRLLLVSCRSCEEPLAIPHLAPGGALEGRLTLTAGRRGRLRLAALRVTSIFPLGLFRKTMSYPVDLELVVFPRILSAPELRGRARARGGERPSRLPGRGHELLTLRRFRAGDDPRGIHWKQTARTGELIFMERELEQSRRLTILFDNGVGEPAGAAEAERFERLVSEAASAADHHLERGWEVRLVTREGAVPFGRGRGHRLHILRLLALIEPRPVSRRPLAAGDPGGAELRLGRVPERRAVG